MLSYNHNQTMLLHKYCINKTTTKPINQELQFGFDILQYTCNWFNCFSPHQNSPKSKPTRPKAGKKINASYTLDFWRQIITHNYICTCMYNSLMHSLGCLVQGRAECPSHHRNSACVRGVIFLCLGQKQIFSLLFSSSDNPRSLES